MRVDQVGSLLRPSTLKSAFVSYLRKMTGEQELHRVQDALLQQCGAVPALE